MGDKWRVLVRINRTSVSQANQVWHAFLCARLIPITHLSNVTKDSAIMLYALAMGFSIDVGKVIYYWIQHIHRASTIDGLGHPSLITELC